MSTVLTRPTTAQPQVATDAFAKTLPYAVVATNIAGAYSAPAVPADLDLGTASATTLLRQGIAVRRPTAADEPGIVATWANTVARLHEFETIVPQLAPLPATQRRVRKPAGLAPHANTFDQAAWAGGAVAATATTGPWVSATGTWVVPTVSVPKEPQGTRGGWTCFTWVGLDGVGNYTGYNGTSDVLQAGVAQTIDTAGNTTCAAWFEWFVPTVLSGTVTSISSGKSTTPEMSPFQASLASVGNRLYMAWRSDGSDSMNISVSTDNGKTFGYKHVTDNTSTQAPAICEWNGNLYIAWKGDGNDQLNVAQVPLDPTTGAPGNLANQRTLGATSPLGPAIVGLNNSLYIAWKGDGNDNLNLVQSTDGGSTWMNTKTFGDTSPSSPSLAACNGQLFIAWRGEGASQVNVAAVTLDGSNAPQSLGQKVVLGETSDCGPALSSAQGFLYLAWKGSGNDNLNVLLSGDDGASFSEQGKYVSPEKSPLGPTLGAEGNQMYVGWRGDGNDNLNVAPVTTTLDGPAYIDEMVVSNFPVKPGDTVTANITYTGTTSGVIQFVNQTTKQTFNLTLLPPPGANFSGQSVEWIVEAPDTGLPITALPNFGSVAFSGAFGCNAGGKTTANPVNGDQFDVSNASGVALTSVTLAGTAVTVNFIG